jgi:hypothetical protein
VLKAPDIPSILVETAFISNPEEEKRLNDDAYQDKMAEAIFRESGNTWRRIRRWPSRPWRDSISARLLTGHESEDSADRDRRNRGSKSRSGAARIPLLHGAWQHGRAAVAQSVEQRIRNAKVDSSIPSSGTSRIKHLAPVTSRGFLLGRRRTSSRWEVFGLGAGCSPFRSALSWRLGKNFCRARARARA